MRDNLPPEQVRARLGFDDAALLRECEIDTYRASGPGGQKRNKTSSAVRLRHPASGIIVIAEESRSQHENKARGLRRLREEIAVRVRLPLQPVPAWPETVSIVNGRLALSAQNPARPLVLGLLLDALEAFGGRLSDAAAALGVTSSSMTRVLREQGQAWAQANRIRASNGLPPLHE